MFLFCICKDTLYLFLSFLIQLFVLYGLIILYIACALFFRWTVRTDIAPASTFVFSLSVAVGCGIVERFVFRTDNVVIVVVVDIFMPWGTFFLTFLVWCKPWIEHIRCKIVFCRSMAFCKRCLRQQSGVLDNGHIIDHREGQRRCCYEYFLLLRRHLG